MKSPIILIESNDVIVCNSTEHATSGAEIQDIKDRIYEAFDSDGFLLDLFTEFVEKEKRFLFFKWTQRFEAGMLKEHYPKINQTEYLRNKIINGLTYHKDKYGDLENMSLLELINLRKKEMPWK